jgi:hypothetical protein
LKKLSRRRANRRFHQIENLAAFLFDVITATDVQLDLGVDRADVQVA